MRSAIENPTEADEGTSKEIIRAICVACHAADDSGDLSLPESQHALKALGFYLTLEAIDHTVKALGLEFPLTSTAFMQVVKETEKSGSERGLCTVPYAWRGLLLQQLKALKAGLLETGWLQSLCDEFNQTHAEEISTGSAFKMTPNLYAMDRHGRFFRDSS